MLLLNQSVRLTKTSAVCLAIGLMMIASSAITNTTTARADDVVVMVDVPPTGLLNIEILDSEGSQTSTGTVAFGNVASSDSSLYERNFPEGFYDLRITVQTNCDNWQLTQHISQDQLINDSGDEIDLYWKTNDLESYSISGFAQNPNLLAESGLSSGNTIDLYYALDVPTTTPPGEYSGTVTYTLIYN